MRRTLGNRKGFAQTKPQLPCQNDTELCDRQNLAVKVGKSNACLITVDKRPLNLHRKRQENGFRLEIAHLIFRYLETTTSLIKLVMQRRSVVWFRWPRVHGRKFEQQLDTQVTVNDTIANDSNEPSARRDMR